MIKSTFFYLTFIFLILCPLKLYAQTFGNSMYEETYEKPYEQPYEQPHEKPYEQPYEQPYEKPYEQPYEKPHEQPYEQPYEKPHEQPYEQPYGGVYGGGTGYGKKPIYEEFYPEHVETETGYGIYENTGIVYGESPTEYATTETGMAQPVYPPQYKTGFVVDMHFLSGDPNFQYIAYHYCQELYTGFSQCDIYNGTDEHSKFVAVEFVVSAEIFATLPMEERKYWHSHEFAVKSGILVLPDAPESQDVQLMSGVINTYGKITDFWHSWESFPYGGAKIAYGLGDASQIIPALADEMDKALGLKTTWRERALLRKNIVAAPPIPGASPYLTTGKYPQYVTQWFKVQSIGVTIASTKESGESTEQ